MNIWHDMTYIRNIWHKMQWHWRKHKCKCRSRTNHTSNSRFSCTQLGGAANSNHSKVQKLNLALKRINIVTWVDDVRQICIYLEISRFITIISQVLVVYNSIILQNWYLLLLLLLLVLLLLLLLVILVVVILLLLSLFFTITRRYTSRQGGILGGASICAHKDSE